MLRTSVVLSGVLLAALVACNADAHPGLNAVAAKVRNAQRAAPPDVVLLKEPASDREGAVQASAGEERSVTSSTGGTGGNDDDNTSGGQPSDPSGSGGTSTGHDDTSGGGSTGGTMPSPYVPPSPSPPHHHRSRTASPTASVSASASASFSPSASASASGSALPVIPMVYSPDMQGTWFYWATRASFYADTTCGDDGGNLLTTAVNPTACSVIPYVMPGWNTQHTVYIVASCSADGTEVQVTTCLDTGSCTYSGDNCVETTVASGTCISWSSVSEVNPVSWYLECDRGTFSIIFIVVVAAGGAALFLAVVVGICVCRTRAKTRKAPAQAIGTTNMGPVLHAQWLHTAAVPEAAQPLLDSDPAATGEHSPIAGLNGFIRSAAVLAEHAERAQAPSVMNTNVYMERRPQYAPSAPMAPVASRAPPVADGSAAVIRDLQSQVAYLQQQMASMQHGSIQYTAPSPAMMAMPPAPAAPPSRGPPPHAFTQVPVVLYPSVPQPAYPNNGWPASRNGGRL